MWVFLIWIASWVICALVIRKFTKSKISILGGSFVVSLGLLAVVLSVATVVIPPTPEQKAQQQADAHAAKVAAAKKAQQCRHDLRCWSKTFVRDATAACKPLIQSRAKYDYKWMDGILDPTFSQVSWADSNKGVVKFFGDRVKFQNGLGNWMRMTYMCTYDPTSKSVSNVEIQPGRLGN